MARRREGSYTRRDGLRDPGAPRIGDSSRSGPILATGGGLVAKKKSTFEMRNVRVGDGARLAQGDHIAWTEGVVGDPAARDLERRFQALLHHIDTVDDFDEDQRVLAKEKINAVAAGLADAQEDPSRLRRALLDMKTFAGSTAAWLRDAVADLLQCDAAQKTLGTVTEAGTRAAIKTFLGM